MISKPAPILTKPVFSNLGLEFAYRNRLKKLIENMHASVLYWIQCTYKNNAPKMTDDANPDSLPPVPGLVDPPHYRQASSVFLVASDVLPASILQKQIKEVSRRWQRKFKQIAPKLASKFVIATVANSDRAFQSTLRDFGATSVKFKLTPAVRDVLRSTVEQNVALIKDIPTKYLHQVHGVVMRSVQTGRSLKALTTDLKGILKTTLYRASVIASDQSLKATSAVQRARQIELKLYKAVWFHSHAVREPRPTHLKMEGKVYDVRKGMWDPAEGEYVFPGSLVGCNCGSQSVIPIIGA